MQAGVVELERGLKLNCPVCLEHNQKIEMVHDKKKDFFKCPDCNCEVWPPTRYTPTWEPKKAKIKGSHSNRSKRFKNKKFLSKLRPWYQRTPE